MKGNVLMNGEGGTERVWSGEAVSCLLLNGRNLVVESALVN